MGETIKRRANRQETGWFKKYTSGKGIDIGCGDDPVTEDCVKWDYSFGSGDAQVMAGLEDESFDWVYSSHCLEHMVDPSVALANWWRLVKPGGHLIVMVPDEDLYEQGNWPPQLNTDHKSTWSCAKVESWSPAHRSLRDEMAKLPGSELVSLRRYDTGYDYALIQAIEARFVVSPELALKIQECQQLRKEHLDRPVRLFGFYPVDQSGSPQNAELSIEGICRKDI